MKSLLYNAVEQAPSSDVVEPDIITRYYAQFDEQFFHFCEKELVKINTFYNGNLIQLSKLQTQCMFLKIIIVKFNFNCRKTIRSHPKVRQPPQRVGQSP